MDWCVTGSCTYIYFITDFGFGVCVLSYLNTQFIPSFDSPELDFPVTYIHDVTDTENCLVIFCC